MQGATITMNTISHIRVGIASPVDLRRAMLETRLPHRRRRNAPSSGGLIHVLKEWLERRRVRSELRAMDDELLKDAGLDPVAVHAETRKPFFLPIHLDRSRP